MLAGLGILKQEPDAPVPNAIMREKTGGKNWNIAGLKKANKLFQIIENLERINRYMKVIKEHV